MCSLAWYFFTFIVFNKFYVCVGFYYKFILINQFIKNNQVNYPCCDIKYFNLHLSLGFFSFFFVYCWWFFFHFFTWWLFFLVRCVHKFSHLHMGFFYVKIHVEKFCMFDFFIMFLCFRFWSLFLWFLIFFPWFMFFFCTFRVTALITCAISFSYQNQSCDLGLVKWLGLKIGQKINEAIFTSLITCAISFSYQNQSCDLGLVKWLGLKLGQKISEAIFTSFPAR